MRVAGVHLADGRTLWVDADGHSLAPLYQVTVRLPEGDVAGVILAAPQQILEFSGSPEGVVVEVRPPIDGGSERSPLPGADMPALGSSIRSAAGSGTVNAIDPLQRRVTMKRVDGTEVCLAVEDIEGEDQTIGK